ncbi:MAG: Gfo/Idh/MocA family oxidoreductase [Armatimonadota bacterium]
MQTVAVVGAERRTPWHLAAYVDCDAVRDVLLAEPDDQRRADLVEPWGIIKQDVADYSLLLADDTVDIVDICAPAHCRSKIATEALNAGKHVICEGPAAMNADDFRALATAAARAERRLLVCIPHLMIPANMRVQEFIDSEETGRISLATIAAFGDGTDRMELSEGWPERTQTVPAIITDVVHDAIAVLQRWLGNMTSVSAFSPGGIESMTGCGVSLGSASGALAQISAGYEPSGDGWTEERRLVTENGVILVRDDSEDELPLIVMEGGMFQPVRVHNPPMIRRHATKQMIWKIVEALECESEPPVTLEEAEAAIQTMAAVYESIESGRVTEIG